ncbi:hypothetical protein BH09BAC2_BH09BAC2_20430 [soil metagenome]
MKQTLLTVVLFSILLTSCKKIQETHDFPSAEKAISNNPKNLVSKNLLI